MLIFYLFYGLIILHSTAVLHTREFVARIKTKIISIFFFTLTENKNAVERKQKVQLRTQRQLQARPERASVLRAQRAMCEYTH